MATWAQLRLNRTVWPEQTDIVLQHQDRAYRTLLTCEDYRVLWGTYSIRRMVRAVLVDVH
jgi:sortase (surface protein transpeptidase)